MCERYQSKLLFSHEQPLRVNPACVLVALVIVSKSPHANNSSLSSGLTARWTDHRGAGDLGGHWWRRHGGLGQGALHLHTLKRHCSSSSYTRLFFYYQRWSLLWRHFHTSSSVNVFILLQARNRSGQVGYVPEKYLQLPSSNSLLSMLQSLAALDARSHSSSNSTEPETELPTGSVNGDSSGEEQSCPSNPPCPAVF